MAKFKPIEEIKGAYQFYCEGCKTNHVVRTNKSDNIHWQFNNDTDNPTINPSLLVEKRINGTMIICHSYIKDGYIQYLNDCTHSLKGLTIKLTEL